LNEHSGMSMSISKASVLALQQAMRKVYATRYTTLDAHLDFLLSIASETLGAVRAGVWRFERGCQRLRLDRFVDREPLPSPPNILERSASPLYFDALKTEFVVDATDAVADPRTCELAPSYLQPLGIVSLLDAPLRALGSHIGVLCVEWRGKQRTFNSAELAFVNAIATQISFAMERDELNQANADLVQRVLYDRVTDLPNAIFLQDHLNQALNELYRGGAGVAIVYADLDHFMQLCNSLGRPLADALLHALAKRIQQIVGDSQVVARAGDDDFAVTICSAAPLEAALELAEKIQAAMFEPLHALERRVHCSLSIGIAARAQGDTDFNAESLIREGWMASRSARASAGIQVFERRLLAQATLEVELEQELRTALANQEFEPHLQPIFDLQSQSIVGFEALMRWRSPARGILTPIEFIQVAQRTGLIIPIGMLLLRQTLKAFNALITRLQRTDLSISFNLSPSEFLQPNLVKTTARLMEEFGIPSGSLSFEITEQVIITDLAQAKLVVEKLHAIGISVALDDFGTGFSALNYLRVLSVDTIKIDRSFVDDLERNSRSMMMMRSLSQLAQNFKINAIAEGVEWLEQLAAVESHAIGQVQGYLIARPIAMDEIDAAWLEAVETRAQKLLSHVRFA
jgi:diguanylate cyclase